MPGSTDYVVADLEPGNYVVLCFLPVGMKAMDGPPPDGPPHFMEGMVAELDRDLTGGGPPPMGTAASPAAVPIGASRAGFDTSGPGVAQK